MGIFDPFKFDSEVIHYRDMWSSRWPDFTPEEVLSPSGVRIFDRSGWLLINPNFLDDVQLFRRELGLAFLINHRGLKYRGFRTEKENFEEGGAEHSFHVQGLAVDVSVKDMTPLELFDAAVKFGFTGIGLYDSWVHIDKRPTFSDKKAIWDFRKKK